MADDDLAVLICCKVLVMPMPPVPGSKRVPCGDCGQPIWISPASAEMVVGVPHKAICQECAAKLDMTEMEIPTISPGQRAEMLNSGLGISPADLKRNFGTPAKRRAALKKLTNQVKSKKRIDN